MTFLGWFWQDLGAKYLCVFSPLIRSKREKYLLVLLNLYIFWDNFTIQKLNSKHTIYNNCIFSKKTMLRLVSGFLLLRTSWAEFELNWIFLKLFVCLHFRRFWNSLELFGKWRENLNFNLVLKLNMCTQQLKNGNLILFFNHWTM